jgi:hypothetical protein
MFKVETGNEVLRRARLAVGILVGAVVGRTRRARATIEMWHRWGIAPKCEALRQRIVVALCVAVAKPRRPVVALEIARLEDQITVGFDCLHLASERGDEMDAASIDVATRAKIDRLEWLYTVVERPICGAQDGHGCADCGQEALRPTERCWLTCHGCAR